MTDSGATRVAVYLDFDNIVISRYDQVHGRNSFHRDKTKGLESATRCAGPGLCRRDASTSRRRSARWSSPAPMPTGPPTSTPRYNGQFVARAVDLVQLFPAAAYGKNGADIRLAVDAVEDMFRLPDLTHVVIVGGDSDYIALAQRCKRLGRYVVGIGVAGASSRSLAAACDEFVTYDALPGIPAIATQAPEPKKRGQRQSFPEPEPDPDPDSDEDSAAADPQAAATGLLERALRIGHGELTPIGCTTPRSKPR